MKKQTKYLIGIGALIIILVASVLIYNSQKSTSFKEEITEKINVDEISSINITKKSSDDVNSVDEIKIEEREQINEIMADFYKLDLKKTKNGEINFDPYIYHIKIYVNKEARFGIDIYNQINMSLYDSEAKTKLSDYETNNNEILSKLENYFK